VAAEEVDKLLLTHGLYLAWLNGFGGHFMGNVGQHCAQPHHVAGTGNLEDHGLAVARGRRDLYLAIADDEDIPRLIAL